MTGAKMQQRTGRCLLERFQSVAPWDHAISPHRKAPMDVMFVMGWWSHPEEYCPCMCCYRKSKWVAMKHREQSRLQPKTIKRTSSWNIVWFIILCCSAFLTSGLRFSGNKRKFELSTVPGTIGTIERIATRTQNWLSSAARFWFFPLRPG